MPTFRFRFVAVLAVCASAPLIAHCSSGNNLAPVASSSGSQSGSDVGSGSGTSGGSAPAGSGSDASVSGEGPVGDGGVAPSGDSADEPEPIDPDCGANNAYPQTKFVDLSVPAGTKVVQGQSDPLPGDAGAVPAGWDFHQGGVCRDGSPAGFFVHFSPTSSDKLYIYLEGGGACDSATFCTHNPSKIGMTFSGGAASEGQTIAGSLIWSTNPQVPFVPDDAGYSPGIFDFSNAANPLKDWNAVYVPYCTGDVHFGTVENVDIPDQGITAGVKAQHFVGHLNLQKYIAQIVPTFPSLSQVLLTGASAGGFGAGLNYGMVQDSFGKIPVVVLDDSGPPMSEKYLPACLQKQWRALWGFDAALPSDCAECTNPDGSGLTNIEYYWLHKYKGARVGFVSTMQDEVIRLFFSQGDTSCKTDDATILTLDQATGGYTGVQYTQGLQELLSTFQCTGRIATYFIGGTNPKYLHPTYHQHIFRNEFYQAITNDGGTTMAQWTGDFVSGKIDLLGP